GTGSMEKPKTSISIPILHSQAPARNFIHTTHVSLRLRGEQGFGSTCSNGSSASTDTQLRDKEMGLGRKSFRRDRAEKL
ncbi:MAG TPA: hypothetical protein VF527_12805, partial [Pyrinomonadaceae bacterium]